jgi:hypothetical protein
MAPVGAKTLGTLINFVPPSNTRAYGYGYGYGEGYGPTPTGGRKKKLSREAKLMNKVLGGAPQSNVKRSPHS